MESRADVLNEKGEISDFLLCSAAGGPGLTSDASERPFSPAAPLIHAQSCEKLVRDSDVCRKKKQMGVEERTMKKVRRIFWLLFWSSGLSVLEHLTPASKAKDMLSFMSVEYYKC